MASFADRSALESFKGIHEGESALLLCNGPSLNDIDFAKLPKNKYKVFGLNKIFLGLDRFGVDLDYFVSVNDKVLESSVDEINALDVPKFISNRANPISYPQERNNWIINTIDLPSGAQRFSRDIAEYVNEGWTVTHVALQIIHYMGFTEVCIVGMDHRFTNSDPAQANSAEIMMGADQDHFDPGYFGFGQSWDLPDLHNSEISYRAALEAYLSEGREVYDCTRRGACTVFPRLGEEYLYKGKTANASRSPTVSVVVPTFNAAIYLPRCLNSLLSGELSQKTEVLVFDDGSSDGTDNLLRSWSEKDGRIRPLSAGRQVGVSAARNSAIREAKGRYITFLDADDWLDPVAIASRVAFLESRKDLSLAHCETVILDDQLKETGLVLGRKSNISFQDAHSNPMPINSLFGRANVIKRFQFDETLRNCEDWRFIAELLRNGHQSEKATPGVAYYWLHKKSAVSSDIDTHRGAFYRILDWVYTDQTDGQYGELGKALETPPKKSVVLREKATDLLHGLLVGRYSSVDEVDDYQEVLDFLNECEEEVIRSRVRVPLLRDPGINIAQIDSESDRKVETMTSRIKEALFGLSPQLFEKISTALFKQSWLMGPFTRNVGSTVDETRVLSRYLHDRVGSKLMIDVGAHHGSALRPFTKRGWKVIAFEPNPANLEKLEANLLNDSKEEQAAVTLEKIGVGAKTEQGKPLFVSDVSSGISGLSQFHDSHKQVGTVDVISLADYFSESGEFEVGFLKIDTEGFDKFVLDGFPWDKCMPEVIECEFEDKKTVPLGYSFSDLAEALHEKGYQLLISEWHPIIEYGRTHDWRGLKRWPCTLTNENAWGNILAFRGELDQAKLFRLFQSANSGPQGNAQSEKAVNAGKGDQSVVPGSLLDHVGRLFDNVRYYATLSGVVVGGSLLALVLSLAISWWNMPPESAWSTPGMAALLLALAGLSGLAVWIPYLRREILHTASEKMRAEFDVERTNAGAVRAEVLKQLALVKSDISKLQGLDAQQAEFQVAMRELEARSLRDPLGDYLRYQRFDRVLADKDYETLMNKWAPIIGLELSERTIGYVASMINRVESNAIGRLATSTQDAVLRVLVAMSFEGKSFRYLEIGALFGVNVCCVYESCRGRYDDVNITVVDPFEGYYGSDKPDVITNCRVNKDSFELNLHRCDVPADNVDIRKALSTDEALLGELMGGPKFDYILVDGDHSYEGVKFDVENYLPMLNQGGIMCIDDYDVEEWPHIKTYVDEEVVSRDDIEVLGHDWRSFLVRKV